MEARSGCFEISIPVHLPKGRLGFTQQPHLQDREAHSSSVVSYSVHYLPSPDELVLRSDRERELGAIYVKKRRLSSTPGEPLVFERSHGRELFVPAILRKEARTIRAEAA